MQKKRFGNGAGGGITFFLNSSSFSSSMDGTVPKDEMMNVSESILMIGSTDAVFAAVWFESSLL